MAIDWASGYTASWRVRHIDPATWEPDWTLYGVDDVSITRSCGARMEEGSLTLSIDPGAEPEAGWYQTEMLAQQGMASELATIATMYFEPSSISLPPGSWQVTMGGASTLAWASERLTRFVLDGMTVRRGEDAAARAADMLRACTPAPVEVLGSFALLDDLTFELNETVLDSVWRLLDAGGWCIRIRGTGAIRIGPKPTEPALVMDVLNASPTSSTPIDNVPNVLYIVDSKTAQVVEVVNESPTSRTSTVSRGRRIEAIEEDPPRASDETLVEYGMRRLSEMGALYRTYDYVREWWPDVGPYDVVSARVSPGDPYVDLQVISQTLTLGAGITVAETARLRLE